MEDDDPLKLITDFEAKVLAPMRVALAKDISVEKLSKALGWARSIENLTSRLDPTLMKQSDRLLLALIDNPRLSMETLNQFLPVFFESQRTINNAKICLGQREEFRKILFSQLKVSKQNAGLKELFRSDQGEYPSDVKIPVLMLQLSLPKMVCT